MKAASFDAAKPKVPEDSPEKQLNAFYEQSSPKAKAKVASFQKKQMTMA